MTEKANEGMAKGSPHLPPPPTFIGEVGEKVFILSPGGAYIYKIVPTSNEYDQTFSNKTLDFVI